MSLNIEEGRRVEKGEVLAEIERTEYQADFEQNRGIVMRNKGRVKRAGSWGLPSRACRLASGSARTGGRGQSLEQRQLHSSEHPNRQDANVCDTAGKDRNSIFRSIKYPRYVQGFGYDIAMGVGPAIIVTLAVVISNAVSISVRERRK